MEMNAPMQHIPEEDKVTIFEMISELQKQPLRKGSTVAGKMDERKIETSGWTIYYKTVGGEFHHVMRIVKDTSQGLSAVYSPKPGK